MSFLKKGKKGKREKGEGVRKAAKRKEGDRNLEF